MLRNLFNPKPRTIVIDGMVENEKEKFAVELVLPLDEIFVAHNKKTGEYYLELLTKQGGWSIDKKTYQDIKSLKKPV